VCLHGFIIGELWRGFYCRKVSAAFRSGPDR
jgi:hypothetical protein